MRIQVHFRLRSDVTRFNGAATRSLRSDHTEHRPGRALAYASMEPQLVRCGMTPDDAGIPIDNWEASMEPQLVRCGMTPDDAGIPIDNWGASMEPQLVRCGTLLCLSTVHLVPLCFNGGRNLFVAECAAVAGNVGRLAVASMGAATCSLRNGGQYVLKRTELVASMGPQLVRCGMWKQADHCNQNPRASMGPQLVRCGMSVRASTFSAEPVLLQWGPQLVRCGMPPDTQ